MPANCPYGGCDPNSKVSLWVLNQMQAVSQFLGVSFEGVEREAIALFTALEREISVSRFEMKHRRVHRELLNLRSALKNGSGRRRTGSSANHRIGA